jgi:hypothetical protein
MRLLTHCALSACASCARDEHPEVVLTALQSRANVFPKLYILLIKVAGYFYSLALRRGFTLLRLDIPSGSVLAIPLRGKRTFDSTGRKVIRRKR